MPGQLSNASTQLRPGTRNVGEVKGLTLDDAKRAARILRGRLPDADLTHSKALEIVAQKLGFRRLKYRISGVAGLPGYERTRARTP